jgi:predicted  nucleic acid-binding Zn-ribbon protein
MAESRKAPSKVSTRSRGEEERLEDGFAKLQMDFRVVKSEAEDAMRGAQQKRYGEAKQLYDTFFNIREFVEMRERRDFRLADTPDEFVRSVKREELAQQIAVMQKEERKLEREIEAIGERVEMLKREKRDKEQRIAALGQRGSRSGRRRRT